jgi:hypothetical protein
LYKAADKMDPVLVPFSGKTDNWPKVPVIISGDQIYFHFYSDPFATYWGWKCIVTPLVLFPHQAWLHDLLQMITHCARKVIQNYFKKYSVSRE